jgi:hypothetical protein
MSEVPKSREVLMKSLRVVSMAYSERRYLGRVTMEIILME